MPVTCTRRLQWCLGHRVYGHENKCGHLHGHNYVGHFTAEAPDLDKQGRVVDFSVLKEVIGGWIDRFWDHGMVLWGEDPCYELVASCPETPNAPQKMFKLPYNPTAENLAKYLGEHVCGVLLATHFVKVTKIVLEETENGSATWTAPATLWDGIDWNLVRLDHA